MSGQPIEVYVELAGKEKYHQSLKGKEDANQHPISAITNLQENLDVITEKIEINKDNISCLGASTNERFLAVESLINDTKVEILNETNQKIEDVESYLKEELSNIDLEGYYTKEETDEKMEGVFHYKGQVPDFESLPCNQNEKGDVYNVCKTGANYVWTGYAWDNLSPTVCLKGYATKDYVDGTIETSVRLLQNHLHVHYYDKAEIDNKFEEVLNLDPELLANTFVYKGMVATVSRLPVTGEKVGETYTIGNDNSKYFWNGANWEKLSEDIIDKVYTKDKIDLFLSTKADIQDVYTTKEIDEKLSEINNIIEKGNLELNRYIDASISNLSDNLNNTIEELKAGHNVDIVNLTRAIGDVADHLEEEVVSINTKIENLSSSSSEAIENINQELKTEIQEVNTVLTNKIETLDSKVDQVTEILETKIEEVNTGLETKITELDDSLQEQIEQVKEDLESFKEEVANDPQRLWHQLS